MDIQNLKDAIALSGRIRHVFIATADAKGVPHIAVAGPIAMKGELVAISAWYCPQTLANIEKQPQVTIAVWDETSDAGFQLVGRCEKIEDIAVMDGYAPKAESKAAYPQVERRLLARVENVYYFTQAQHADK
jgi:hypothetical protein